MPKCWEGRIALGGLAAIFIWTFAVLPILYQPSQRAAPDSNQEATNGQQQAGDARNEPPSFIALKLFTSAGRYEIATYCQQHGGKSENDWRQKYICDVKITDVYLALFNLLLVGVTVGLIGVGALTIRKMRDTEQRQLRAYVFIDGGSFKVAGRRPGNPRLQGHIDLKNFGQTPAYDFRIWTGVGVFDTENVPLPESVGQTSGTIGPGAHSNSTAAVDISGTDMTELRLRNRVAIMWGAITYVDAFNVQRFYKFHVRNGQIMSDEMGWEIEALPGRPDKAN
jgi:hypothetical protein